MARLTERAAAAESVYYDYFSMQIGPTFKSGSYDGWTDEEMRLMWELHGKQFMEEWSASRHRAPGKRPWVYWEFVLGRPEHLTDIPDREFLSLKTQAQRDANALELIEWEIEPYVYLAEQGELSSDEIAALAEKANEARLRVGTKGEQIGTPGVDRPDLRAVKLYEAVSSALRETRG